MTHTSSLFPPQYPEGVSTTERCVPVVAWSSQPHVARTYLQRWCRTVLPGEGMPDPR